MGGGDAMDESIARPQLLPRCGCFHGCYYPMNGGDSSSSNATSSLPGFQPPRLASPPCSVSFQTLHSRLWSLVPNPHAIFPYSSCRNFRFRPFAVGTTNSSATPMSSVEICPYPYPPCLPSRCPPKLSGARATPARMPHLAPSASYQFCPLPRLVPFALLVYPLYASY